MKKFTFLFVLFLFGHFTLQSQTPWRIQTTPVPDSVPLGKIQFVNTKTGFISVSDGRVLKTVDGGANWEIIDPFSNDSVFSLDDPCISMFWDANGLNGWLMNTRGTFKNPRGGILYRTTDGGKKWEKVSIDNKNGVIGAQVQFTSSLVGYASTYDFNQKSGKLFKSQDGGKTWGMLTLSNQGGIFHFINEKQGWMVSAGPVDSSPPQYVYHTEDGGMSWPVQYTDTTAGNFTALQFPDSLNGWVIGKESKIYKTADGGKSWQKMTNTNVPPHSRFSSLFFLNPDTGWVGVTDSLPAGNTRHILATVDGGKNWASQRIPSDGRVFSIFFKDKNNGFYTGDRSLGFGYGHVLAMYGSPLAVNQFIVPNQRIKIYPNPNHGNFYLSVTNPGASSSLEIMNLSGKRVYFRRNLNPGNPVFIRLSYLPKGIYFVKINTPQGLLPGKIILIR